MHSVGDSSSTVPAFLGKLWKLVEDPTTDNLINWNSVFQSIKFVFTHFFLFLRCFFYFPVSERCEFHDKRSGAIRARAAAAVLQTQQHGQFRAAAEHVRVPQSRLGRIGGTEAGQGRDGVRAHLLPAGPRVPAGTHQTENPRQQAGREQTQTRTSLARNKHDFPMLISVKFHSNTDHWQILTEVRGIKGKQENVDSRLTSMKRENEALWREVATLRQKHMKQQQIVNKLIQFLISIVQPSGRTAGLGIKRR